MTSGVGALAEALHAAGPDGRHADKLAMFGRFVGSWRIEWSGTGTDVGRPDGPDIVPLSDEEDPWLRWRFTDIAPDSFRWMAEVSSDHGATWEFDEQMRATR